MNTLLLISTRSPTQVLTLFIIKTITMSDFLSWDTDLDLDLLLEEYTEYDPSDSGSDDYD
jgi:hypothetical protein